MINPLTYVYEATKIAFYGTAITFNNLNTTFPIEAPRGVVKSWQRQNDSTNSGLCLKVAESFDKLNMRGLSDRFIRKSEEYASLSQLPI